MFSTAALTSPKELLDSEEAAAEDGEGEAVEVLAVDVKEELDPDPEVVVVVEAVAIGDLLRRSEDAAGDIDINGVPETKHNLQFHKFFPLFS